MSSKGFIDHASVAARRMLARSRVISLEQPVAQVVLEHPRCAQLLVECDIDFCCRGTTSLREACATARIDAQAFLAELQSVVESESVREPVPDPRSLSTLQLVSHIVDQHHANLRKTLPLVELLAARVVEAHSEHETRLAEMHATLRALRGTLESHLDHEESVLFPLLIRGGRARRTREQLDSMRAEHLRVGDTLRKIRMLADRFVLPSWACATYAALMAELETLEQDTLEHVHLENNVLAPRFDAGPLAPTMQRRRSG
jgi:regulator of cell morphogenesis and NO signaling